MTRPALGVEAPIRAEPSPASESVAVIVAVSEEPEDLAGIYEEYAPALRGLACPFEFIFALDAPWRAHAGTLAGLEESGEPVRVIEVAQTVGEAALVRLARDHSSATLIVCLPPYRRVVPQAIPKMVERVIAGAELVLARRWPRIDSRINRVQSRLLHLLIGVLLGRAVNDVRCGVRAMRPRILDETVIYGDFFRYLPIVAARQGFTVVEMETPQHRRDVRARIYSPATYLRRLLDILALFVLLRFSEKPLRFFGSIGLTSLLAGSALLAVLLAQRLDGVSLANRPLLLLAGILVVVGVEAIALGLIGELIVYLNVRSGGGNRTYRVVEGGE